MTTAYSSFFSSGLLAAPHNLSRNASNVSPSLRSASDVLDDISDMELDRDRSKTPTPAPVNVAPQPRLRRRRSSLTTGTSSMNSIKSPTRAAGNALHFQRHLYSASTSVTSSNRSRSGSASSAMSLSIGEEKLSHSKDVATENNSLMRRLRSGSVGSVLKSRRTVRRVPGPSCPPPSAPLPPLPALPSIPGTPGRSKTKAFSLAVPSSATQALAQKLAGDSLMLQTNVMNPSVASSPTLMSPRQPLGDLQPHGYGYVNDQEMRD
jgi:hypothetical protein